jgi:DNA-binding transcriptional LysR family regulator
MQIKALEEELGVVLLDRSKKPVIPTEAGEVVLEQVRETLKEYNSIREVVAEMKGEISGKLRLGVIPTIAPYLLHKFIPTFVRDYPKVELEISEMKTADIIEALKRDRLDAALVFHPLSPQALHAIAENLLRTCGERFARLGVTLVWDKEATAAVCAMGDAKTYGARPLRRILARQVEDPAARMLLSGELVSGNTLRLTARGNQVSLTVPS